VRPRPVPSRNALSAGDGSSRRFATASSRRPVRPADSRRDRPLALAFPARPPAPGRHLARLRTRARAKRRLVTSCVGWVLAQAPVGAEAHESLRRASAAVLAARREWAGDYNRHAATDAGSTAWALRFLAALGWGSDVDEASLVRYLDEDSRARTFLDGERFGRRASVHDDVTPVVGLALVALRADASRVAECGARSSAAYDLMAAGAPSGGRLTPTRWRETSSSSTGPAASQPSCMRAPVLGYAPPRDRHRRSRRPASSTSRPCSERQPEYLRDRPVCQNLNRRLAAVSCPPGTARTLLPRRRRLRGRPRPC
jgi:hypothetical protein